MSDDRLFSTSYRYEVYNPNSKALRKSLALQESRIKTDELIASRLNVESIANKELEVSRWMTNFEESSQKKRKKREAKLVEGEVKLQNKELVMTRRAQLKNLLDEDKLQYEKELGALGKAFYTKRV